MTTQEVIADIATVSSGTLARAFGSPRYDEIDKSLGEVIWHAQSSGERFENWFDLVTKWKKSMAGVVVLS